MSVSPLKRLSSSLIGVLICGLGCGPFGYLKKVSVDATRAVAQAEKAGAEKYAPYEYWGAVAYLQQARQMMAYSEYERSFDYGARAAALALEARRKAERHHADGDESAHQGSESGTKAPSKAVKAVKSASGKVKR